jgi:hypothetical protein
VVTVASDTQENNMASKKDLNKAVKILTEVHPDEIAQAPNVHLYYKDDYSVTITTGEAWYKRLWFLLTNPFRYLFTGKWKF